MKNTNVTQYSIDKPPCLVVFWHPPHGYHAKFGHVLLYPPYQFGKELLGMQDIVNNKQTHFRKQNFSETKTSINKNCMLLFNLGIIPAVC